MKKKLAIFLTAAAMVLSLAACGNQDNKNNGAANNGTTNNGTTNNGTTNNGTTNNGTNNHGTTNNGTANNNHNSVGDDLKDAANDVGDAVGDAVDGVQDALDGKNANNSRTNTANTTSFQQMLDNARVHDRDGVLTDGENSTW